MNIPARVHFCWIGAKLSWAHVFAILSAARQGGMDEIVLHHTDELADGPELQALRAAPGVTLRRITPESCLAPAEAALGLGDGLTLLYAGLASPVMRADVLRAAILYAEGGIYLDLDTVTVASLRPLLGARQFVGAEHIVWPEWVRRSRSPFVWAKYLALDVVRKALRAAPSGWRLFRHVERFYFKGMNNAVMGAAPGAPLFAAYLTAMAALRGRHLQPYALGPDLLETVARGIPAEELVIHEPGVFYPLPPEISAHWFRPAKNVKLDQALKPETLVVHWYASVRTRPYVPLIGPDYVRAHARNQLYSALVCRTLANGA